MIQIFRDGFGLADSNLEAATQEGGHAGQIMSGRGKKVSITGRERDSEEQRPKPKLKPEGEPLRPKVT